MTDGTNNNPARDHAAALDISAVTKPTNLMNRLATMNGARDPDLRAARHKCNWDRAVNREALMGQVVGSLQIPECRNCQRGDGPFESCVVVARELGGSCACCHYNSSGARCSLRGMGTETRWWKLEVATGKSGRKRGRGDDEEEEDDDDSDDSARKGKKKKKRAAGKSKGKGRKGKTGNGARGVGVFDGKKGQKAAARLVRALQRAATAFELAAESLTGAARLGKKGKRSVETDSSESEDQDSSESDSE